MPLLGAGWCHARTHVHGSKTARCLLVPVQRCCLPAWPMPLLCLDATPGCMPHGGGKTKHRRNKGRARSGARDRAKLVAARWGRPGCSGLLPSHPPSSGGMPTLLRMAMLLCKRVLAMLVWACLLQPPRQGPCCKHAKVRRSPNCASHALGRGERAALGLPLAPGIGWPTWRLPWAVCLLHGTKCGWLASDRPAAA